MSLLDCAGVKAYLGPENVESVDGYQGSYEQGVKINVMKFQAEFAISGLRRFDSREPKEENSQDADLWALCPSCNSRDVVFQGLDVESDKEPPLEAKSNWTCAACGHQWKDDGIEKIA